MNSMPQMHTTRTNAARLVPSDGLALPLQSCDVRVEADGGLARVVFEQRFHNPHREPLHVTYKLPLPHDAAVSGFSFEIGERRIVGTVQGRSEARETFEQAMLEGRTAALLEQERASLFTQELGNIPPGAAIVAQVVLDQPLVWLDAGYWEWRFPLAAAPRYLGTARVDGNAVLEVAEGGVAARASLSMTVRDRVLEGRSPESTTHPLSCNRTISQYEVELGSGNQTPLDRDIAVRWPVATPEPGVSLSVAPTEERDADHAYGLLTIVPPMPEAGFAAVPRDLTLLIDTSGSMAGAPLDQAKHICSALVSSLTDRDTLEMIEFSNRPTPFRSCAAPATAKLQQQALKWIRGLQAGGGTEMLGGVREAMRELRPDSQRQIAIITDGLVGFEAQVVREIQARLPASATFHAVGVGSATNRSLLAPIARAGRGVEVIVGLGDDAEQAAQRLLARTSRPVLINLSLDGPALMAHAPERLPDLFAGAPAQVALKLSSRGGTIILRGRTAHGLFERSIKVPPAQFGEGTQGLAKHFARERVEDLEVRISAAGNCRSIDREIEEIGKAFQISTRLTSWIAVTDEPTVDRRHAVRKQTQPNALPFGMSAQGLGLRQADEAEEAGESSVLFSLQPQFNLEQAPTMDDRLRGGLAGPASYARSTPVSRAPSMPRKAGPQSPAARGSVPPPTGRARADIFGSVGVPQFPKKESLASRASKAIGGLFRGGPATTDATAEAFRPLTGTIQVGRDGKLFVVVDLLGPDIDLSYDDASVDVVLQDGTQLSLAIDTEASTEEGVISGKMLFRIAVNLGWVLPPQVRSVSITLPHSRLQIEAESR